VHHGGVGTVAVGLKHGKPTLVIPAFGDLFFWWVCAGGFSSTVEQQL
jgi:UDP:flavonoid glycosyltransferase YjiC (YdhE family)